jgi:hypothetical protein
MCRPFYFYAASYKGLCISKTYSSVAEPEPNYFFGARALKKILLPFTVHFQQSKSHSKRSSNRFTLTVYQLLLLLQILEVVAAFVVCSGTFCDGLFHFFLYYIYSQKNTYLQKCTLAWVFVFFMYKILLFSLPQRHSQGSMI